MVLGLFNFMIVIKCVNIAFMVMFEFGSIPIEAYELNWEYFFVVFNGGNLNYCSVFGFSLVC